jgi:hypothetical protein
MRRMFHNRQIYNISITNSVMSRFRSQGHSIIRLFMKETILNISHSHFSKSVRRILVKKDRIKVRLKTQSNSKNPKHKIEITSKLTNMPKFRIFLSTSNLLPQRSFFKISLCPLLPIKPASQLNNLYRLNKMCKQVKAFNMTKMKDVGKKMQLEFPHSNN